jgi:hypothetical protein
MGFEPNSELISTLARYLKYLLINLYRQSEQKVSKEYNNEIGYETLRKDWEVYKKQAPRGVTLVKGGNSIYLQFKTPSVSRSKYKCDCTFSINGMIDAVRKAHRVAEKLKNLDSEVEFWNWYDKEIKQESRLVDDRLTFGDAIAKVEDDFWDRPDRRKRVRDRNHPSDQASWYRTYNTFYQHLPVDKTVNLADILTVINIQKKGSRNYGYAVSAMKKLAEMNKRRDIYNELSDLDATQTIFASLQSVDLKTFLSWRDGVLGISKSLPDRCDMETRKAWMWVFSIQIVYALRIGEVFAIKNLAEPYTTKDGVSIPALNDPDNTTNLIYIGDETIIGTTVKTGARIARPQIPPKYPDLMERLEIKNPLVPDNRPKSTKPTTLQTFFGTASRQKLIAWDAPFTQTHADRHLGNINGMQAGISDGVRAKSLGHTVAMNDSGYKKRLGTQTTIDLLLNSNQNAIDFVTALGEAKKLVKAHPEYKDIIAQLLSIIYQKNTNEINRLL